MTKKNSNVAKSKYNEVQLMKKLNREFDERCIKLRNRIQKIKMELQRNKEERDKELFSKKMLIQSQREKDNEYRVNKRNANLSQKKINYQTSLNDKYLMKIIREQLNTQQLNKNTYSHAKVRQELIEYETNKMKRNLEKENQIKKYHQNNIMQLKKIEKEMKNTCNQLEEQEKEAIESLNKTKTMNMKIVENNQYNYNIGVKFGRKMYKKTVNKSMENLNLNGIIENNCEEEDFNPNKSVYVKKNRIMSPTHKKNNCNLNFNNKSKTKNSISINSFPKGHKGQNSKNNSNVDKNNKTNKEKNIQNKNNKNIVNKK